VARVTSAALRVTPCREIWVEVWTSTLEKGATSGEAGSAKRPIYQAVMLHPLPTFLCCASLKCIVKEAVQCPPHGAEIAAALGASHRCRTNQVISSRRSSIVRHSMSFCRRRRWRAIRSAPGERDCGGFGRGRVRLADCSTYTVQRWLFAQH